MFRLLSTVAAMGVAASAPLLGNSALLQQHQLLAQAREVTAHALSMSTPAQISTTTPKIPGQWMADVHAVQVINGKVIGNPFGTDDSGMRMCQDSVNKRMTQQTSTRFVGAPAEYVGTPMEWMNSTIFHASNFSGMQINGNTYAVGYSKFNGLFDWLPLAHDAGTVTEKGQQLQRWSWTYKSAAANGSYELWVKDSATPVHMRQLANVFMSHGPHQNLPMSYNISYNFSNFQPNKTFPEFWAHYNQSDYTNPMRCPKPAASKPVTHTMYIFHPANEFDIAGQDLGDALGDTVFVCVDALTNFSSFTDHSYAWLTKWEIDLMPQWGQYQNCNGYNPSHCTSAEHSLVGHEAAYYLGSESAAQRQCGTNPDVGEWYSLPPQGECKGDAQPGDGSCTWRKKKVKTIDGKCLIHTGGFAGTCVRERRAPYPEAMKMFLKAFERDDPQQGGCPPIGEALLLV